MKVKACALHLSNLVLCHISIQTLALSPPPANTRCGYGSGLFRLDRVTPASSSATVDTAHATRGCSNEQKSQKGVRPLNDMSIVMKKSVTTIALAFSLMFSPSFNFEPVNLPILHTPIALAADYGSLTDEQKAVAEAWRIVDNNFIDRTFNNQDWWKIRQDMVKKKYKNMGEAQAEIDKMVSTLGDKYTRYLPPSKYRSIVDAATGTLAGVGVEITSDKETGKVLVADTEPSSPASRGGIRKGDVFIEVDGARFDDNGKSTPDDVASKLRGPEGSRGK
jgi:hypothetical protein